MISPIRQDSLAPAIETEQVRTMIKPTRNSDFTIHVKQLSDGGFEVRGKGFKTGKCLIALITVMIEDFMNGSGCSFEEVMKMIEKSFESLEEPTQQIQ